MLIEVLLSQIKPSQEASGLLLGQFIEHLGRCIENGIWFYQHTNKRLLNPPLDRIREDLFQALKLLSPPIIRYPGGCFSDTYHWKDGIGNRNERPTRKNKAWNGIKNFRGRMGPIERNHFGTDEFLQLCEKLGCEAYLNVNYGSGTPQEAAEWVEYTNGDANTTEFGAIRAKNGHPEPYNVRFWGIANEIYGFWETGYERKPAKYASRYLEFEAAMRDKDPSIKCVAVGCDSSSEWNQTLLGKIQGHVDFLAIHRYFGAKNIFFHFLGNDTPKTREYYHTLLNSSITFDRLLLSIENDIQQALGTNGLSSCKIAFDEWNVWARYKQIYRADNPNYDLAIGLWTALLLNTFIRHSNSVGLANYAQMVNCLGMLLVYGENEGKVNDLIKQVPYHVFKVYRDAWLPFVLDVQYNAPSIISKGLSKLFPPEKAPVIDIVALTSENNGKISLFCVNRDFDHSHHFKINFSSQFILREQTKIERIDITCSSPFDSNTQENPSKIVPEYKKIDFNNLFQGIELPPHTISIIGF